jgi:1,4-dihydroxy-2-naphthoate octaprenyltransferase
MQGGEILSVYTMGTCLAFFYTAPPLRLKYFALGDIAIFLAFGPLLCYCSLLLVSDRVAHTMWAQVFASTIPCACICECILHANNSRDIGEDRKAGLITLATLLGFDQSRRLYIALISIAYLTVVVSGLLQAKWSLLLVLASAPLARKVVGRFCRDMNVMADLPKQTAKLHMAFGLLLILGTLLG